MHARGRDDPKIDVSRGSSVASTSRGMQSHTRVIGYDCQTVTRTNNNTVVVTHSGGIDSRASQGQAKIPATKKIPKMPKMPKWGNMFKEGFPWDFSELKGFPWDSSEFKGFPWDSSELKGFPWDSSELL